MARMDTILDRKYRDIVAQHAGNDARGKAYEKFLRETIPHLSVFQGTTVTVSSFPEWANAQPRSLAPIKHDTGMDFVVEVQSPLGTCHRYGVQAKFFERSDKNVGLDAVTGLLGVAAQVAVPFDGHYVISNAEDATKTAAETALRSSAGIEFILRDRMARELGHLTKLPVAQQASRPSVRRPLWPHQVKTVTAVIETLAAHNGMCHYVSACGTGKTVSSWAIAERLGVQLMLFAAPQLSLLNQTIASYRRESGNKACYVVACSDFTIGMDSAADDEVTGYVCSNASDLAERVRRLSAQPGGPIVVLTTYQSAHVIAEAQMTYGLGDFDYAFLDEAHRLVSAAHNRGNVHNGWQLLDNAAIRVRNRVAATATPRIIGSADSDRAPKYDRMNEEFFGPLAYKYPFGKAIEDGVLVPYDVLVHTATEGDAARLRQAGRSGAIDVDFEVSLHSVKQAFDNNGARRFVAYLSSRKAAEKFAQRITDDYGIPADFVDGTMSARERAAKFARFGSKSAAHDGYLLANVNVVTEGVDIPNLDAVVMAQSYSSNSSVSIAQSVGRVLRTAPGKERGLVIVPAVFRPGQETPSGKRGERRIISVLVAMMQHDASLGEVFMETGDDTLDMGAHRQGRYSSIKMTGPMPSAGMVSAAKDALRRVSHRMLDISRRNVDLTHGVIMETITTRLAELGRRTNIESATYRRNNSRYTTLHADIVVGVYREFETDMSNQHARFAASIYEQGGIELPAEVSSSL